jgi:biotin transport system substrate-specific component
VTIPVRTAVAVENLSVRRRVLAVLLGTALVAGAAQVTVPLPGTPVPMTLQPLAVLIVGGLLGPSLGAASLLLYVAIGAAGAPVFTPSPLLPYGIGRVFGPTGGYLLAYPLAAYAVGRIAGAGRSTLRLAAGALAGLVLIHLGGLAQLALITGSLDRAARFGTLPFLLGDIGKLVLAVLILRPTVSSLRARL